MGLNGLGARRAGGYGCKAPYAGAGMFVLYLCYDALHTRVGELRDAGADLQFLRERDAALDALQEHCGDHLDVHVVLLGQLEGPQLAAGGRELQERVQKLIQHNRT
eukprot:7373493-Pyramimonas_sp.AAC.1